MAKIMIQLRGISAPVINHYHGDLDHDYRALQHGAPKDMWLWQCRPCGTHIIPLRLKRHEGTNAQTVESAKSRLDLFDAVNNPVYGPARQWYLIEVDSYYGDGSVAPVSTETARDLLQYETRRLAAQEYA